MKYEYKQGKKLFLTIRKKSTCRKARAKMCKI